MVSSYSPDGSLLAFATEGSGAVYSIVVIDRSTGTVQQTISNVVPSGSHLQDIEWSHDANYNGTGKMDTRISYEYGVGTNPEVWHINTVDYANPTATPVSVYSSSNIIDAGASTWSPDDSKLLFEDSGTSGSTFTFNTVTSGANGTTASVATITGSNTTYPHQFDWRR